MITLVSRSCGLLLAIAFAATACTTPATGRPEQPAIAAETSVPGKETTVLGTPAGAASALGVSAQLFRRAPVVVVAAADDPVGTRAAATVAQDVGAPVLLGPVTEPVRRELDRLAPKALVVVGAKARQQPWAEATQAKVYASDGAEPPAGLPDVTRPEPARVTVLVDDTRDDTAARATARAAGASVVPVRGADPRTDPRAITALHAAPPGVVLAVGPNFGPPQRLRDRLRVTATGKQLPGGGQVVLHDRRFVCLYGHPGTASLGVLGEQGLDAGIARAKKTAASYEPVSDVPVVPAFELIATVAQGSPGPDGNYSNETSADELRPWVERAGDAGLYVVLDLQPGRADLTEQARRYESLLRMPHVGLAVDPEWKLGPDQRPLEQIGGIDAAELNRTSAWLAGLTARHALPQKMFVVHQFRLSMIRDEQALDPGGDEVSVVIHMDGQGTTGQKNATWRAVTGARPDGMPLGWKNFHDEDHPMLSPEQTMAYEPKPVVITYQ